MPDSQTCADHGKRLNELERRFAVFEALLGATVDEGLRGLIARLSTQLDSLTAALTALQLAQARATGAVEGATWLGRALWALFGAAISGAAVALLRSA